MPHSWGRALIGFAVLEGFFQISSGLVRWAFLADYAQEIAAEIGYTLVVSAPFVALVLALLRHQVLLHEKLSILAETDPLTGLINRRSFFRSARQNTNTERVILLMVDMDHFRKVNELHGHRGGDTCLRALARHLQTLVRPGDDLARLGGDEFAATLHDVTLQKARAIAQAMTQGFGVKKTDDYDLALTASVGLAVWEPGQSVDQVLNRADEALFKAKAGGRAQIRIWTADFSGFDTLVANAPVVTGPQPGQSSQSM